MTPELARVVAIYEQHCTVMFIADVRVEHATLSTDIVRFGIRIQPVDLVLVADNQVVYTLRGGSRFWTGRSRPRTNRSTEFEHPDIHAPLTRLRRTFARSRDGLRADSSEALVELSFDRGRTTYFSGNDATEPRACLATGRRTAVRGASVCL